MPLLSVLAALALAQAPVNEAPPDPAQGQRLFESQCALCHGQDGRGGRGPSLARPRLKHVPDEAALRSVIRNGIEGGEMPGAWQLSPHEVASVAAYVRSLGTVRAEALPGDPGRGAKVYQARGCGSCHILRGEGTGFGPDLT